MATYAEGEVVRIHKLGIMQMRHEGSLAAVREQKDAAKGLWACVLPSGDVVEVTEGSMKKLDADDMFTEGDLVRIHGLPMMMISHEQTTAIVQHYVPQKDAWSVQLRNGHLAEVYSGSMKMADDENMFYIGEIIRVVSGDGAGQVVTVKGYLPPKDAWAVFLPTGASIEVFSENCTKIEAAAHAEGDLVVVDGMNVVIQKYNESKDNYTVISPDGQAFDVFKEEISKFESPKEGATPASVSPSKSAGGWNFKHFMGMMGGGAKDGAAAGATAGSTSPSASEGETKRKSLGGMFGGMKSMLKTSSGDDAPEYTFNPGDQAHLKGFLGQEDGTIALVKEPKNDKGKYKVILATGKTVSVSAGSLKPPVDKAQWPDGTLVTLKGDRHGIIAAVQMVVEEKGMLCLRLPNGKAKYVFPDQVVRDGEEPAVAAPAAAAAPAPVAKPKVYDTQNPLYPELVAKLQEAGTTFEEVTKFNDAEIDELLKDELKIPLLKRVRMKNIIKGVIATPSPKEAHIDPTAAAPAPAPDAFGFLSK